MKLYRFHIDEGKLQKDALDVEEKPKTYTVNGCDWRQRIAKDDIGAVDCKGRVHIFENDTKKAVAILRKHHVYRKAKHDDYHKWVVEDYNKTMAVLDAAEKECVNE